MKQTLLKTIRFLEQHNPTIVGIITGFTILAGIVYAVSLGETLRFLPDEKDYLLLAENLVTKGIYSLDGIHPTAYRAPGYPLFLAVFNFFHLSVLVQRIANFILLGLSIWLANTVLVGQDKPLAGLFAACWLSFGYPVLFYTAGTFYPQTLAGFLLLLGLMLVNRKSRKWGNILFAGLALGLLSLTVPVMLVVGVIIAFWLWRQRGLKNAILLLAIMIISILPWSIRNYAEMGSLIFFTTGSGENLLLGNSENSSLTASAGTDISTYRIEAEKQGLTEVQKDIFYRDQAVALMLKNPTSTVKLYILKFLNYYNFRNQLVTTTESSAARDLLMLVTYTPLLFCLLGSLIWQKWGKLTSVEILALALYCSGGLVYAMFFTRIRFRLPYDCLLILVVSSFMTKGIYAYLTHAEENNRINQ